MKVLVDTNVYLELFLKRNNYEVVKEFFFLSYKKRHETFITSQSLRDIEYVLRRACHNKEISKILQHKAYEITTKVISISNDAAIEALYSDIDDYEDALQDTSAEEHLLDAIITFNVKDYKNSKTLVFTPQDICKLWLNA